MPVIELAKLGPYCIQAPGASFHVDRGETDGDFVVVEENEGSQVDSHEFRDWYGGGGMTSVSLNPDLNVGRKAAFEDRRSQIALPPVLDIVWKGACARARAPHSHPMLSSSRGPLAVHVCIRQLRLSPRAETHDGATCARVADAKYPHCIIAPINHPDHLAEQLQHGGGGSNLRFFETDTSKEDDLSTYVPEGVDNSLSMLFQKTVAPAVAMPAEVQTQVCKAFDGDHMLGVKNRFYRHFAATVLAKASRQRQDPDINGAVCDIWDYSAVPVRRSPAHCRAPPTAY